MRRSALALLFYSAQAAVAQLLPLSTLPLAASSSILSLKEPSVLRDTLVPRTVGSAALRQVQDLYEKRFKSLKWTVEVDQFEDDTPVGRKTFRNLIFTSDPAKPRTVVLAAHLDSKPTPKGFVGAIDSAAPCAILLDVATALNPWLQSQQASSDTSITVILFDGEEAFVRWTAKDSIYGARHLAKLWSAAQDTPSVLSRANNRLASINVFILFDLLGAPKPEIRSFFRNTNWLFERFAQAQSRISDANLVQEVDSYFSAGPYLGHIEDDHIPFLKAGVPVLHLIPAPFPKVWHKMTDNIKALDQETINTWSLTTQLVVAELLAETPRTRDELVSGEAALTSVLDWLTLRPFTQ